MRKNAPLILVGVSILALIFLLYSNYKPKGCQVKRLCPLEYKNSLLKESSDGGLEFFYMYETEDLFETVKSYYDKKFPTANYELWSILRDDETTKTYNARNVVSEEHVFVSIEKSNNNSSKIIFSFHLE